MLAPHIVKSYDEQLLKLHALILEMGLQAERQLAAALTVLAGRDAGLAARIVENDDAVDALEREVNDHVVRLLALRAPVADDLRVVISGLKIASTLERAADYAVSIARRALSAELSGHTLPVTPLTRMGESVLRLLAAVMEAYRTGDAGAARSVWQQDHEVDEQYSSLFRQLLTYMMEDPRHVAPCSHLLFIAKHLERIGDLTTNIGEMVHFLCTGQAIAGERPKHDTSYGEPA